MSQMFPKLFEPGRIGTLTLKNRIAKAPQSSGMNNIDGSVSERAIRYYRDQAAGGAGMIIVEYAYVDEIGSKSAHCHLGISNNEHIPGLSWLAENIREMGSVPAIQIEHCGRQKFLGTQPIKAPSAIAWPNLYAQHGLEAVPQVLTIPEIHDIVHAFGDAAARAKRCGFELVELHGAHGYLLTNFFSPTTNHRTDMYGGTLENRARIYFEILEDVRAKVGPDFPVTIRLSGTDYEPDGFPIEDTVWLAKQLEARGIDGINVSGGDHHTMIHQVSPMAIEVCHNVWAAEAIKREVKTIPIMASGSITLPEYAEDILESGKGDFVVLGRPLWADPEWPKKAEEGRPEDIRPCIRCNEGCLQRTFFEYKAITCALNPVISREGELKITPAERTRKVAVVGGGAAGMEAARVARLRGHDVTIFEERERMGGLLNEAAAPEFKSDIRPFQKFLETQVNKLDIPVVHKRAVLAELEGFDAIVCATGSLAAKPPVPGADKSIAVDAITAIDGAEIGHRVVVVGGGLVGTETALDLAERGHEVTVVEMLPQIMNDVAATDFLVYSERIAKCGMASLVGTRLEEVTDTGVVVSNKKQGRFELEADTVILALGLASQHELYDELRAAGREAYLVGDAVRPGKIFDAIHTAYRVGLKI